jgi:hypothetical protein
LKKIFERNIQKLAEKQGKVEEQKKVAKQNINYNSKIEIKSEKSTEAIFIQKEPSKTL